MAQGLLCFIAIIPLSYTTSLLKESCMAVRAMTIDNLDIAILDVRGSFTGGDETDELKLAATDLYEQGNRKLIIDLANANYFNSLGIGALINIHAKYTRGCGLIKLCNMGKGVENVFVITKLISIFDVEETREEAIKNFKNTETPNSLSQLYSKETVS
jgi:anti-anti-sigma factor